MKLKIIIYIIVLFHLLNFSIVNANSLGGSKNFGVVLQIEAFLSEPPDYLFDKNKWNAAINKLKWLGVKWVRLGLDWRWIQNENKNNYSWNSKTYPYDYIIDSLIVNDFQILALVSNAPPWSNGGKGATYPPNNPADFGNFLSEAVKRYGGQIKYWEIWNEPNISEFWEPSPNVSDYMKLLSVGYNSAKMVDPNCKIVSAGLAHSPDILSWLQAMYDNTYSLRDYCDIVGFHNYTWHGAGPYEEVNKNKIGSFNILKDIHNIMVENNDAEKKVWLTEQGWLADDIGEELQALYLNESIKRLNEEFDFAGAYFWFEFVDQAGSFGLLKKNNDLTKRQSYDAYKLILSTQSPKNLRVLN